MSSAEYIRQLLTQSTGGPSGPQGSAGVQGQDGSAGYPGVEGEEGTPGTNGTAGDSGLTGLDGYTGQGVGTSLGLFPPFVKTSTFSRDISDTLIIGKLKNSDTGAMMIGITNEEPAVYPLKTTVTKSNGFGSEVSAIDDNENDIVLIVSKGTNAIYSIDRFRNIETIEYANEFPFSTPNLIGIRYSSDVDKFGVLNSNGQFATLVNNKNGTWTWGSVVSTGITNPVGLGLSQDSTEGTTNPSFWFTFQPGSEGSTTIKVIFTADLSMTTTTVSSNLTNIFVSVSNYAYIGGVSDLFLLTHDNSNFVITAITDLPSGNIQALQYNIVRNYWIAVFYDSSGHLRIQKNTTSPENMINTVWNPSVDISGTNIVFGKPFITNSRIATNSFAVLGTQGNASGLGIKLYSTTDEWASRTDATPPGPVVVKPSDILIPVYSGGAVVGDTCTYQLRQIDKYRTFVGDGSADGGVGRVVFSTDQISDSNFHINLKAFDGFPVQSNLGSIYEPDADSNVIANFNGTSLDFY